mmetsp:Transcript_43844/g.145179  ORF Transcript_43844/g.145179 Transcript_43844/m.145179 type:complete len:310 (+) Transcript_43844:345-1274(+)
MGSGTSTSRMSRRWRRRRRRTWGASPPSTPASSRSLSGCTMCTGRALRSLQRRGRHPSCLQPSQRPRWRASSRGRARTLSPPRRCGARTRARESCACTRCSRRGTTFTSPSTLPAAHSRSPSAAATTTWRRSLPLSLPRGGASSPGAPSSQPATSATHSNRGRRCSPPSPTSAACCLAPRFARCGRSTRSSSRGRGPSRTRAACSRARRAFSSVTARRCCCTTRSLKRRTAASTPRARSAQPPARCRRPPSTPTSPPRISSGAPETPTACALPSPRPSTRCAASRWRRWCGTRRRWRGSSAATTRAAWR